MGTLAPCVTWRRRWTQVDSCLAVTVGDELAERDANLVLLLPVVSAVAEDAGEFVQRELRGVLVDEDGERGCRKHVGSSSAGEETGVRDRSSRLPGRQRSTTLELRT